jgi:hypothetical protein
MTTYLSIANHADLDNHLVRAFCLELIRTRHFQLISEQRLLDRQTKSSGAREQQSARARGGEGVVGARGRWWSGVGMTMERAGKQRNKTQEEEGRQSRAVGGLENRHASKERIPLSPLLLYTVLACCFACFHLSSACLLPAFFAFFACCFCSLPLFSLCATWRSFTLACCLGCYRVPTVESDVIPPLYCGALYRCCCCCCCSSLPPLSL